MLRKSTGQRIGQSVHRAASAKTGAEGRVYAHSTITHSLRLPTNYLNGTKDCKLVSRLKAKHDETLLGFGAVPDRLRPYTRPSVPMLNFMRSGLHMICMLVITSELCSCAGVEFHAWEGQQQKWPTSTGALVDNRYAVPTYYGYPPHAYTVIGVIQSSTKRVNRFAILSYAANRAKALAADAILAMPRTAESDAANPFADRLGPVLTPTTDRGFFSAKASVVAIKWQN